eukprot:gene16015-19061_t
MCQQTRISVVIEYFEKWMKRWPTISDLAKATLDEVNEMWAGLGYYRRASNLHTAAKTLVEENAGKIPDTAELLAKVRGIGPYTAGAISSIAFGRVEPLVDGNVIRVLSRLRAIGASPKLTTTSKLHWQLARDLVDPLRPGDFNQSLMELGATAKTDAKEIPANSISRFFISNTAPAAKPVVKDAPAVDIEDLCKVCETWEDTDAPIDSVTKFPRKVAKTKARDEVVIVYIVEDINSSKLLIVQRPFKGLLGSLWEAPSQVLKAGETSPYQTTKAKTATKRQKGSTTTTTTTTTTTSKPNKDGFREFIKTISPELAKEMDIRSFNYIGSVNHIFSHIKQTLDVHHVVLDSSYRDQTTLATNTQKMDWVDPSLGCTAISNQMKKCFKLFAKQ